MASRAEAQQPRRSGADRPSARATRAPAAAAGLLAALALTPGVAAAATVPPGQDLVVLRAAHDVRIAPSLTARRVAAVAARRPLGGAPTTLPLLARTVDTAGLTWVRVRLPGRSLGGPATPGTGWMRAAGTTRLRTAWHLVVHVATRELVAYRAGVPVRRFRVVVGAAATPTPRGAAFVEENLRLPRSRTGAPFALALSARSPVLQEFDGGPGQVALHGRGRIGGRLGTAASHGCVRLGDAAISWLAARIRPGVPVTLD